MGDFLSFAEREDGGAGTGDGKSKSPGGEGGVFSLVEIRDEFLATSSAMTSWMEREMRP